VDERARQDFSEFVAARSGELLRLAYVLTADPHAAEDLLQSTLTRAAAHRGRAGHRLHRDTAWTDALPAVADGAGLRIAEAYYFSKAIPYHLSFADLAAHRGELACRRVVLTHMSADMLARGDQPGFETARDGCVIHLPD
jgi:hypothetical protein